MKKIFWCGLFLAILAGCAGPKYIGSAIEDVGSTEIVIINDVKTRSGFQDAMQNWLFSNNYKFLVIYPNQSIILISIAMNFNRDIYNPL